MTVEEGVDTEEHSVVDGGFVPGYMKGPRRGYWESWKRALG